MPGLWLDGSTIYMVKCDDCSTLMHIGAATLLVASFRKYHLMFVFCRGRGAGGSRGGFGGGKSSVQNKKLIITNKGRALFSSYQ